MKPNARYANLDPMFWANVRLISQHVGYTERLRGLDPPMSGERESAKKQGGPVKVPNLAEIQDALERVDLSARHLIDDKARPTRFGKLIVSYFEYRADILNNYVQHRLMNKDQAKELFEQLHDSLRPRLPLNKQKKEKKAPSFFTGIINMLIEANVKGLPCDYDPRELTTFTRDGQPFRTLARRIDGAFPGPVNPIAVWEIKEYYYTTTFGSRVADGVYESLLDGMELREVRDQGINVNHYLMIDDHFTWWDCGRSYLCRVIDMMHMGYVGEVLFGNEVLERIPAIVKEWVAAAKKGR